MLIALYAGEITQSCKRYIKPGGIILTNNHHSDAETALSDASITLDALVYRRGKKYIIDKNTCGNPGELKKYGKRKKVMRYSGMGMEYVDNQCYFVLKKNKAV